MKAATGEEMIPLPQVCARLRLTWGKVYNMVLSGRLEGKFRGTRWFIAEESVLRFEAERGTNTNDQA